MEEEGKQYKKEMETVQAENKNRIEEMKQRLAGEVEAWKERLRLAK